MSITEENLKFLTLNSPYMSRRSLFQLKQLTCQKLKQKISLSNFPDQEELKNQLNAKQEQINSLSEEVKKLKTQMEQKERDIKNYQALVIENASNLNQVVYEGEQQFNRRTLEINLRRNNQKDKQEIEKLSEKIKKLEESIKVKSLGKLIKQNHDFAQQIQIRNDIINGQTKELQKLQQQFEKYQNLQNYQVMAQELPNKAKEFQELQTKIDELQKAKEQVQRDLFIVQMSYQLIKQSKPSDLQIKKQRRSSFQISHKGEIEILKDFRSKSISQDNNFIVRNFQLIYQLENKNIQKNQKIKQQSDEILKYQKLAVSLSEESQLKENEIKKINQDAKDNLQIYNEVLDNQQQQNEQLNLDLKNLKQELDRQKQQNEQLNKDLKNLKQELDRQKQQNEQFNKDLINLNQVLDNQQQQNEQLNLDLKNLKQELDRQKQQNEQLNKDLKNLKQELDRQKQQNEQFNKDLINLNQVLDNQQQQNQQLNLDLINLNSELENQQQQNQQLNSELENQQQQNQQLNSELENQQQQNQQLNSELENQQQQNQQLNLDLINLNSELDNQKQILQKLQSQNKDYNNNILDILNQLDIRDQNNQTTNLSNEINEKISQLQIDSDTLKYGNSIISLMVRSVNSNRSEIFKVRLKDSINDLYLMTVSKGIHNQLPLNISLLVPSKNKRIATSDWNKKFYDIFGPNENNETIPIEFSGLR